MSKDYQLVCSERCPDGCGKNIAIDVNRLRKVEDGQMLARYGGKNGTEIWICRQADEEYSEPPMHITGYTDYATFNVPNTWLPCTAPTREEYESELRAELALARDHWQGYQADCTIYERQLKAIQDAYAKIRNGRNGRNGGADAALADFSNEQALFDTIEDSSHQPESICQDCKGPNIVWFTDNATWNRIMGGEGGIVCPVCFVKRAEASDIPFTGWKLSIEESVVAPRQRFWFDVPKPKGKICICWAAKATEPMAVCNDCEHWCHSKKG